MRKITQAELENDFARMMDKAETRAALTLAERAWAAGQTLSAVDYFDYGLLDEVAAASIYDELNGAPNPSVSFSPEMGELGGWLKKLKKKVKKSVSKVGKSVNSLVKQAAPLAVPAAAALIGGPMAATVIAAGPKLANAASSVLKSSPQTVAAATQAIAGSGVTIPGDPQAAALSPQLTRLATSLASQMLAKQGVKMESPEAQAYLQKSVMADQQRIAAQIQAQPDAPAFAPSPTPESALMTAEQGAEKAGPDLTKIAMVALPAAALLLK